MFSCSSVFKKIMFSCSSVFKKTCSHVLLSFKKNMFFCSPVLKNPVLPSKNNFFQKKSSKHLAVSNKSTTFALALKN